jgi:hypothetical protein
MLCQYRVVFNFSLPEAEFELSIYPNPARNNITIIYANCDPDKNSIRLYNLNGILLKSINI